MDHFSFSNRTRKSSKKDRKKMLQIRGSGVVAQQVRAYVILAEGLGSVPSTHGAAPVS